MAPSVNGFTMSFSRVCAVIAMTSMLTFATTVANKRTSIFPSISEMINTEAVEQIIAARRMNASRPDRRYLAQNDLDDELLESNSETELYEPPDTPTDFEKRKNLENNNRIGIDILMKQYNASAPFLSLELLAELSPYSGRKLLKSSRNALVVTEKEYLKKDWCKTEPLVQKIKEDGCISRTIINQFCYGQCNSFYIPRNPGRRRRRPLLEEDESDDTDQTGVKFKSCSFCKPKKFTWITVTLVCPSLNPPLKNKRIQIIEQCSCLPVNVN